VNALGSLVYFGILGHIGLEVRALDMTAAKGVNSTHTYLPSAKPCRIARRAFESRYLKAVSTTKVSQRLKRKALGAVNAVWTPVLLLIPMRLEEKWFLLLMRREERWPK
jgi:hypothetical protein